MYNARRPLSFPTQRTTTWNSIFNCGIKLQTFSIIDMNWLLILMDRYAYVIFVILIHCLKQFCIHFLKSTSHNNYATSYINVRREPIYR